MFKINSIFHDSNYYNEHLINQKEFLDIHVENYQSENQSVKKINKIINQ